MSTATDHKVPGTELAELQYIAHIVARSDDAESRIQDILRYLDEHGGLRRGRVLLADPAAEEIYIRYAHGLTAAELEQGRYRIGEGLCGLVFQAGEAALAAGPEAAPGERSLARDRLRPTQIGFIAVPIVRDDLPIGVLAVERQPDHERPAESDLAVLEVVATLITEVLSLEGQAPAWVPPVWIAPQAVLPYLGSGVATTGDPDAAACDLMLRMAQQRHAEGRLHLAADLYLKLAEEHFGAEQTLLAKSKLLEIACYYESKGHPRLAAGVLERLRQVLGRKDGGNRPLSAPRMDPWNDPNAWSGGWDSFGDSGGPGGIGVRIR